ncbi:MAG: lipoprotein signal peptidase [Bacteroidota bacterium]
MSLKKAALIVFLILLADQIIKIYVKTHFTYGEKVEVLSWFHLHFIENKGMAWGVQIPGEYGKLILTIFRLFAIAGIGYWLWESTRKHAPKILVISIALIFAGAFGNIIDSVFYGVIFEESGSQVARIFPEGGGYGTWFHGKVVDMFSFSFFNPVFNLADFAISVGVGIIIVFNRKAFPKKPKEEPKEAIEEVVE